MDKKGQILITVFLIILLIVLLGISFFSFVRLETIQIKKQIYYLKALNIAEGGIERALWKMKNSPGWTDGWENQPLGDGYYSVSIQPMDSENYYKIISIGTVRNVSKTVELEVEIKNKLWPSAFDYVLFWGNSSGYNGDLVMKNNVYVEGNVFVYGNIEIRNNATVTNGYVYSTGEITGEGNYQIGELPDPLPERPEFDTSYYDGLISEAFSHQAGNWSLKNNKVYYLDGKILFVNGDVSISNNCFVYGPGKIVATGNITVENNSQILGNVDLIADGNINIENNAKVEGEGNIIFSNSTIVIKNNDGIGPKTLIYSEGTVELKNNAQVRGIIWGNEVELLNNATVYGMIYGDSFINNTIRNNFNLIYDPEVFDITPPTGVPEGEGMEIKRIKWNEKEAEGI